MKNAAIPAHTFQPTKGKQIVRGIVNPVYAVARTGNYQEAAEAWLNAAEKNAWLGNL